MSSLPEKTRLPAVFLSYAREDAGAARRLADALRAAGIEVWFDQNELRGGDEWDRTIRRQIRECALFVPVISANTQVRTEGYFRLEWHLAEQRSLLMARGRPFLVPVCIDATAERDALVAEAFLAVHWTRLTDGEALAAFVQRMTGLLRGNTPVRAAGSGTAAPTTARAAGAAPPGAPRIADYELLRVIGRGSYGDVWLARGVTGIYRAIKVVWRERFADAGPFEREFKGLTEFAAISLGESIQMALLHIGRNDDAGYFYYVMELADDVDRGREIVPASYAPLTLTEARKRRGRLPTAECVGIGVELARVLAGLHRRGLIHRDIKPSNIIFVGGVAKLADIGLVTAATDASTFVGTEGFVPPEGPGSASADVFALGKLLYELATGLHRQEFPQLPAEVNRLPDAKALFEFNEIILRACEPDRAKRYGTADAMLADLRALQAGISLRQRRVGKKVLRFGAAAAAVVVSAAGVWWKSSWPASPDRSAAAATPAPAVPIAAEKSIAVLPFANLSDEKADAYFADGVHAEIISSLAKIIQLRVVSNSSVRPYRESKKSLGQIAQELGVVYLLEGDVQRANDRVRVSGRLILAATGAVIWADKFERALADIFSLQSELSQIIAEKLQAKLAPEEKKQLITDPTKSLAAYDLFLRARSLSVREDDYSGANTKQMEDLYTQAVGLDPDFTEAWVNLADIQILRGKNVDEARQQEQEKKARASLEQVKRLAPNSSDLEKELGYFFLILHKDYDRALRHFREALRLKPSSPWALAGVATVLYRQGDWTGSTAMAQRASKLDPGDIQLRRQIAYCLEWMRRFPEAAEQVRRIMEIIGENLSDRYVVVLDQFLASGDTGPAEAFFAGLTAAEREIEDVNDMAREWARITGNFAEVGRLDRLAVPMPGAGRDNDGAATNAAFALAALGDLPTARARLADWPKKFRERAPERNGNYFITLARAARMEALLGHRDVALDYVRRAAEGVPETRDAIWNWSISYNNAITLAWLGDKDGAIAALGRLLRTAGGSTSIIVARDAAFFPLRGDPRFEALMADPATHAPIPWSPDPNQPEPMPKLVTAAVPSSKSMVSFAAVAAPAALASNQKSIAVLPFENMSEDKAANAFFADGMQEDILTNLGVVRALRVTSRTSVMQYRATTKTARQIGAELGVAYLLEGSVRRAGGRVRVTGQLIDTRTDEHVWAKAYDRDLADIFSLQSELAQEIAGALSAVISPQEKTLLDTRPTTNLAAYDRYLGARAAKTDEEAEKLLLEAVALDPDFADAWALLVNRHAWNYFIGADRGKPARLAMAKVALDTTVRLAPGSTAAIVAQGDYCYYGLREYEQAAGHYQRSLALRPNSAMALEFFGYCCRRLGRWGEAVASLRQASKLNPNDPNLARNVTDLLWGVRRYAEAAAEYLHLAELEPASANPRFRSVLMTFYATGSTREVDEWFARQPAPAAAEAEPQWAQQRRWLRARGDFTEAFRFDQQHPPKKEPGLLPKIAALFDLLGTGEAAAAKAQAGTLLPEIDTLIAQERKLPGQDPYHWETLARGATLHAIAGDPATARGLGREFLALRARRPDAWVDPRVRNQYAQILALAGEKDLALAELAQSLRMPYGANVHLVRHDPAWRPFRGDPRFEALLADPKNNAPLF